MRKVALFFIIIFIGITLLPERSKARSFSIDEANLRAFVLPDGDLYVEELYTYTFQGSYNGTTRTIGRENYNGIEFFEAYQADGIDPTFHNLDPEELKPLEVEWDEETFKIHQASTDVTRKFFYRYRLKGVMRKYRDVGEFYWRFFDDLGEDDIHHLRIETYLYDKELPENHVHWFLHDLTGATLEREENAIVYENELLPGGETVEIRFLFPQEFLSEMPVTEDMEMLNAIIKEETNYTNQLNRRKKWLPILEERSNTIFLISVFSLLGVLLYLPRIMRIFRRPVTLKEMMAIDSFSLVALDRKLHFKPQDIHAALFRLYQRDVLMVEYIAPIKERADESEEQKENESFLFTVKDEQADLHSSERYLIDWLFKRDENKMLTFSTNEFLLEMKRIKKMPVKQQTEALNQWNKHFKEWRKRVREHPSIKQWIRPVWFRIMFVRLFIPFWFVWMNIYLWTVNMEATLFIKGMFALISVMLVIQLNQSRWERILTTVYLCLALMVLEDLGFDAQMESFYDLTVIFLFISAFLPKIYPTIAGIPYLKGIKHLSKLFLQEKESLISNPRDIERLVQHANALEMGKPFLSQHQNAIANLEDAKKYPFLTKPYKANTYIPQNHLTTINLHRSSGTVGGGGGRSSGGGGGAGAF